MRHTSRTIALVIVFLLGSSAVGTLFHGCAVRDSGSTLDVTLTEGTILLPLESIASGLIGEDETSGSYSFRPATPGLDQIQVGSVVILAGKALRRVSAIEDRGGEIVVSTQPATLNEAIQDGTIDWKQQLDFGGGVADLGGVEVFWGDVALASQFTFDGEAISYSGQIRGFRVEATLTPEPGRLNIEMTIRKKGVAKRQGNSTLLDLFLPVVPMGADDVQESEEDVLALSAKGWIGGFSSEGEISYEDSALQTFTLMNTGMHGNLELKFAAIGGASTLRTGVEVLNLPMKFQFPPIMIGGWLPVSMSIGVTPRITAAVTSPNASSRGAFEIEYSADQGFSFHSGIVEGVAQLHSAALDIDTDATISAGQVTTAFSFGLQFPRIEVHVMGELVVPFLTIDTYGESYYEPGILSKRKACQRQKIHNKSVAGVNLSFLGFEYTSETELWNREIAKGSECE